MPNSKSEKELKTLDANFWNNRWEINEIGWDIGYISPPIEKFIDSLPNKAVDILIPGCGNAYEAEYLLMKGFNNITIIDIAPTAVELLQDKFNGTSVNVICQDFFQHRGSYDLIIEQTFFCAIPPHRRKDYVNQTYANLKMNGKIAGVLFNTQFEREGPPFGGTIEEYRTLFKGKFTIKTLELCYNSIPSREGRELFVEFIKD